MKRRYGIAVSLILIGGWVGSVAVGATLIPTVQRLVSIVVTMTLLFAPAVVAGYLIWQAWWRRYEAAVSTMDGPARLLALAAVLLPEPRRAGGTAMAAELAHVPGRWARWRFAAGCARAAVTPSRVGWPFALAALTVAVVAVLGQAVGPDLRVFVGTFVALVGLWLVLALARSGRLRRPASGLPLALAGLFGAAGCVASTGYLVTTYPSAAEALQPAPAVVLAVVVAGCLGLILAPPRWLSGNPLSGGVGLGLGLLLSAGFLVAAHVPATYENPRLFAFLFPLPIVILFAASATTAAVSRSMRVGAQTGIWALLVGVLYIFVGWPVVSGADEVGVNLLDAIVVGFVLFPLWTAPFGVMGAALGARLRRRSGIRDPA
jgi:hypothetical protein